MLRSNKVKSNKQTNLYFPGTIQSQKKPEQKKYKPL